MKSQKRDLRVIVCGDRYWTDPKPIIREIYSRIKRIRVIIEGDAPGADTIAGIVADTLIVAKFQIGHMKMPANWSQYGKAAGPIRNRQMLKIGRANLVLAFHKDISRSKGTKDMLEAAESAGVKTKLFSE